MTDLKIPDIVFDCIREPYRCGGCGKMHKHTCFKCWEDRENPDYDCENLIWSIEEHDQ